MILPEVANPAVDSPPLLTTADVAGRLQCRDSAVRQWAREGSLPFQSWLGKRLGYRFSEGDLATFLDSKRREHNALHALPE